MRPKKIVRKKIMGFIDIKSLVQKNLISNKFTVNPSNLIEGTKNKIGNFYKNLKKEREKEQKRLEQKRKLGEKKELQKKNKQAQKVRLDKIRHEKKKY